MSKRAGYLWNCLVRVVLEIVKLVFLWGVPVIGWALVVIFILIELKLIRKEKVSVFLTALATKIKWGWGRKIILKLRDKLVNKT